MQERMMARILTLAEVPDDLANAWLQHMRDFDAAHPGCHFTNSEVPDITLDEIIDTLKIDPPLPFGWIGKVPA
jgi:hypothetical protein